MKYQDLDVVVAARDLPKQAEDELDVPAGTLGAVVSVQSDKTGASYWVEFIDDDGYTLALLVLDADDIAPAPQKEKAEAAA